VKTGSLRYVLVCLGCLLAAQVVAMVAWPMRPAATHKEFFASDENLGEVFVEMEPGEFAGTLMLGGLRGLVTDLLWLRATGAKENGRFYESVALFNLISKVQPRYEQVWEFMAHDMAYNIAVEVGPEERWGWFLVGMDAINRGSLRNPRSVRLLRFHAWMFHHKGELFMERVEGHDWTGLINPLLRRHADAVAPVAHGQAQVSEHGELSTRLSAELEEGETRLGEPFLVQRDGTVVARAQVVAVDGTTLVLETDEPLPESSGDLRVVASLSNFQLSGMLYRAALSLGAKQDLRVASYVRRLVALGIEKDGNRLRNRSYHLAALERYITSLEDWQAALAWVQDPANNQGEMGLRTTVSSYERNEGQLRRRAGQLGRKLAPDPILGAALADALMEREFETARYLLTIGEWKTSVAAVGGVRWYDE
jgi:hypothetical protein